MQAKQGLRSNHRFTIESFWQNHPTYLIIFKYSSVPTEGMKIRVGWGEWVVLDGHNLPPSPVVGIGLTKKREEGNCPPAPSLLFTTLQAMHCNRKTSFLLLMDNLHFHTLVFSRDIFWNIHTVISCEFEMLLLKRFQSMHWEPFAHSVF